MGSCSGSHASSHNQTSKSEHPRAQAIGRPVSRLNEEQASRCCVQAFLEQLNGCLDLVCLLKSSRPQSRKWVGRLKFLKTRDSNDETVHRKDIEMYSTM